MAVLDSCHETQRVELVRNMVLPRPAAARTGLPGCHPGWVWVRPGPMHSAFWGSIIQRPENATKVCQVPFFDQISRLYWNHSMQHRFMFECIVSFYVVCLFVLWMKSGKTLVTMFFKKIIKQGLLVFFYRFVYISVYFFFFFFSLIFISFIWPKVLRCGNSFYHFWVIDYQWVHTFLWLLWRYILQGGNSRGILTLLMHKSAETTEIEAAS